MGGSSGGGGSQSAPTTTTVNNSNIPDYLSGQAQTVSNLGVAAMNQPYQGYNQSGTQMRMADGSLSAPGQQVAGFNTGQLNAQAGITGMQSQGGFGQGAAEVGGVNPNALFQGTSGGPGGSSWINPGVASSFMNPYQQNVINVANTEAARNAGIQQNQQDSQFAGAGALGGSRQGVVDAESARSLGLVQANNEAQGMNQAYQSGQQQYNTQQGLALQSASNQGNMAINQGVQQANIANQTQAANLGLANAQLGVGNQVQGQNQTVLNAAGQDFTNQQNYNMNQALMASSVLHGTPYSTTTTGQTYMPPVSTGTQLAGLGIAGVGAYNSMTAGKRKGGIIASKPAGLKSLQKRKGT